jgi:hypothetical protein
MQAPPKLALLCFREDVAGRECPVPCDLCDVIAEPGFCFVRCTTLLASEER